MSAPFEYVVEDLSDEQVAHEREVYGGFTDSVRQLMDASLRTTVDEDEVLAVQQEIEVLTERLRKSQIPRNFGVVVTTSGHVLGHGNAVVGLRNPIAVPLDMQRSKDGRTWAEFELNALYEGPPGNVHGGVIALVLDQVLGESPAAAGSPGMTGTLTLRYLTPTPLGKCSAEAWIGSTEGVKTIVKGVLRNARGEVTVEANGIFILPRWAREELARSGNPPPKFE